MRPCRAVIFDLDGSILNTLEDLHRSVNFALNCSGLPERSLAQVRHDVGNGIRTLILRSVPDGTSDRAIAQVYGDFQRHYKLHCADLTRPYNGIPELLEEAESIRRPSWGVLTVAKDGKVTVVHEPERLNPAFRVKTLHNFIIKQK